MAYICILEPVSDHFCNLYLINTQFIKFRVTFIFFELPRSVPKRRAPDPVLSPIKHCMFEHLGSSLVWSIHDLQEQEVLCSYKLIVTPQTPICRSSLEKWSNQMYPDPEPSQEEVHMFDLDCFLSDISDTLFTMTQKPSPWNEERHNSEYHRARENMFKEMLTLPFHNELCEPSMVLEVSKVPCESCCCFLDWKTYKSKSRFRFSSYYVSSGSYMVGEFWVDFWL